MPSLLRGFSAPVKLRGVPRDRLRFLAAHDTDPFVRWDSGQQYAAAVMLDMVAAHRRGEPLGFDAALAEAVRANLAGADADPAFAAEALPLPGEKLPRRPDGGRRPGGDPPGPAAPPPPHRRRAARDALRATYDRLADRRPLQPGRRLHRPPRACATPASPISPPPATDGMRRAQAQFDAGANMTDVLAALCAAGRYRRSRRATRRSPISTRAGAATTWCWTSGSRSRPCRRAPAPPAKVRALQRHPDFDLRNPNRARSLVGAFASGNPVRFHDPSGEGYRFLADAVMALDPINASTAARLVAPLGPLAPPGAGARALMRAELERILATPDLSKGTFEKASKALA